MLVRRIRRIQAQLAYRHAMPVQECRAFGHGRTYAVCPRCRLSMEREYVRYCSHCGQHLSWEGYDPRLDANVQQGCPAGGRMRK